MPLHLPFSEASLRSTLLLLSLVLCTAAPAFGATVDNAAPVAVCNTVTVNADANCMGAAAGAEFGLNSSDPDDDPLTFTANPAGPYSLGSTPITLTVSDGSLEATCNTTITVTDDQLPAVINALPEGEWEEAAKALASDGAANDQFGRSVAISGDYAIVSARRDDTNGSAYIFQRTASGWTQQTKLVADDGATADLFGESVSISGDYAIVGAPLDDDNGNDSGSAYIFQRTAAGWTQQAKLVANDGVADDNFGLSVSISGDNAIVGVRNLALSSGYAYVFRRTGSIWTLEEKLDAEGPGAGDNLNGPVSISGNYAIVGAFNPTSSLGSAYVFQRDEICSCWSQQDKLVAENGTTFDGFGGSVSIFNDYAIVGAWQGGDNFSGVAYVYQRMFGSWVLQNILKPDDGVGGDAFGWSVSISGDYAIVGAYADGDNGSVSGSAYVFQRTDTDWTQRNKILASDGSADDEFGRSVSISGDYAIVGAFANDDNGSNSGSAYFFTPASILAPVTAECSATPATPTATDNCGGTINGVSDTPFPITDVGTTTVTWTFDDGEGNIKSATQEVVIECDALPVNWQSFTARQQGKTARLDWATTDETDHDYFTVEWGTDGQTFTPLATVQDAERYTTANANYGFNHQHPAAGINYYRIRQVDFSGHFSHSSIESVDFVLAANGEDFSLFPNPAGEEVRLSLTTGHSAKEARLMTITGKLIRTLSIPADSQQMRMPLDDLPQGIYLVRVGDKVQQLVRQ